MITRALGRGRRYRQALLVGTTLAGALSASAALAAAAAPAQPEAALEEVIVTAQRTQQQLQDVPMSVQAITTKQLELQGISSGQQLTAMVPNLVVGSQSSNGIESSVVIRGIPEVGLYIDGIWQPNIGFREAGIVEMERVEVLRGPQGTLFGRNTNGGAINYVTVKPRNDFHFKGGVEVGSFKRRYVDLSVDIPVSDTLLTKWTAASQDQGGYVKSLTNGKMYGGLDNKVLRGDILWKPNADFSVRITGSQHTIEGTPAMEERFTNLQTVGTKGANVQNIAAYNVAMMNPDYGSYSYWTAATPWLTRFTNGNKWTAQNNSWQYPGGRVGKWENDQTEPLDSEQENTKQATATVTWSISPHLTFTNLAGYIRQDSYHFDNDPAAPVYQWNQLRLYRNNYLSEEAHLEGNFFDNKLSFLAGFYFLHTRQQQRTYSWAYQEMYTPVGTSPVAVIGSKPILDQNLLNFIHQWGAANANTPVGQTLDPMTGKTIAQDLSAWQPRLSPAGQQPANATDFDNMITDNRSNDYSVFLNVTWHPLTKLDLQGGLRLAKNNGRNLIENPTGAFRTVALPMTGGGRGYGPGEKFGYSAVVRRDNPYPGDTIITPMATATYHWTDDVNTFFRFAEGYTTGSTSFNTTLNQNITLDPEIVYDYEAGIRSDWFNRRLRINLTGYHMIWAGKQISTSIPVGNTFAVVTTSGGKSRAQGFEAEMDVAPTRGLRLSASVATLDTKWLESGTQHIPAKTMWGLAPKWTYHLSAQYDFELANQGGITLRADYGHQGKYQRDSDPGRQLLTPEPGYGILNARIQYTAPSGNWNVQAFGTNLTDEAYVDAGTGSVYLFGVDAANIGQRRIFGARLNVNY